MNRRYFIYNGRASKENRQRKCCMFQNSFVKVVKFYWNVLSLISCFITKRLQKHRKGPIDEAENQLQREPRALNYSAKVGLVSLDVSNKSKDLTVILLCADLILLNSWVWRCSLTTTTTDGKIATYDRALQQNDAAIGLKCL